MAAQRLRMRQIRNVLKLHYEKQLSQRQVARACDIGAFVTRMHVGQNGGLSKRIILNSIRAPNPTAVKRMLPVVDRGPANAGRLQFLVRLNDGIGNARD